MSIETSFDSAAGPYQGDDKLVIAPSGLLALLPIGVLVCDIDERRGHPLPIINEHACTLMRLDLDEQSQPCLDDIPVLEFGEPLLSLFRQAIRQNRSINHSWLIESGGTAQHICCTITPLNSDGIRRPRVLCTLSDRTVEKRAEETLLHQALHDELTGLPNRNLFLNRLEEAVSRCREESDLYCAVLMLNVDRFQLVNESSGHQIGDKFLIDLAESLRGCLRSNDLLARFSGDEFAILITNTNSPDDAVLLADRIHKMMEKPRCLGETDAYMSISIGIASTHGSHKHPEELIRDADISMHRAKKSGRGRTEVFLRGSYIVRRDQIKLETALRHAIHNQDLELFYQPVIDLESGRIVAFEALTRWHDPERGFISPGDFIPIAEDTGLIMPLGRWAMHTACKQLVLWKSAIAGLDDLYVNVNLSPVQLLHEDIPATVRDILAATGLDGKKLRLEITESALVADPTGAAAKLHEIKAQDVTLALDDFGTGYSSLNYLNSFPIDCIKIDRSFVSRVERDEQSAKIIRIITMLADTLHMSVIAEGIENSEQHMMMRSLGCRYGQGFLFARPLPHEEAEAYLRRALKNNCSVF